MSRTRPTDNKQLKLWPDWRYFAVLTDLEGTAIELDQFHRRHAVIELAIRMIGGGVFPGWSLLIAPVIEAALWPLVSLVLLAPQRRTPEPDANRPL